MRYPLILLWVLYSVTGQAGDSVGLLSLVSGDVQILRQGQAAPVAARTADVLAAGDRVLTGGNSEAGFLFCPEARAGKILAEAEVEFAGASLQVRKGKLGEERKVPSCRLPANLALAASSQLQSGMLRLRGSNLSLLSPSHTTTATLQPRFRWGAVENATVYEVKLMDREEQILWRQSVSGTELQYPAEAYALAWGQKYWWRVAARDGEETVTEAGSYFQVLPSEKADQVRVTESGLRQMMQENPGDNSPLFLLAFLYEENEMLDEAARLYAELSQRIGPQPWLQARLNDLMNKLGWDKVEAAATQ